MATCRVRRGATMITVVILLPVLFALAAIAVNLAYIQVVNTKLQIVTDSATRAAGWEYVETGDENLAFDVAQQMATLNPVESTVMSIASTDLQFGKSERTADNQAFTFVEGVHGNAVRLTTNSFASGAGDAVRPFFPIFGTDFDIRPLSVASIAQSTLDVAVIVDKSGSMAYAADESVGGTPAAAPEGWVFGNPVPPRSRWLDLVASVNTFCYELEQTAKVEKVALCGYDTTAATHENLTETYYKVSNELNSISANFEGGRTAVGDGILQGLTAVTDSKHGRNWANKVLVVMSDGDHNEGTDPIAAANSAVAMRIPVFTVTFSAGADQTLMKQIADMTGGSHHHAVDAAQLSEAFRTIAKRLPAMLTE